LAETFSVTQLLLSPILKSSTEKLRIQDLLGTLLENSTSVQSRSIQRFP
jgi:hypothetical protein